MTLISSWQELTSNYLYQSLRMEEKVTGPCIWRMCEVGGGAEGGGGAGAGLRYATRRMQTPDVS